MMQASYERRINNLQETFLEKYGAQPKVIVRAPGRVNLIGEHTDYNEGFVFPAAIDREMIIAAAPSDDEIVSAYSLDYHEDVSFSTDEIPNNDDKHHWSAYLRGVVDVVTKNGGNIGGLNLVTSGNVPQGAGLSSSASFEVGLVTVLDALFSLNLSKKELALLAQKAENEFVGVQCGIMDQFVSAMGEEDSAIQIDCRSLEYRAVPLNLEKNGYSIVITHSGVHRGLVDSEYNARRNECLEGVRLLSQLRGAHLSSLRDVSLVDLSQHKESLPERIYRRCLHVVSENQRVLDAVAALENGDIQRFGYLMNESHESMKTNYEISTPEIDVLVKLTQALPATSGSRLTGAGFGGCTVSLIRSSEVDNYKNIVIPRYEKETGNQTSVYVCSAKQGASFVTP